jgi:hypothetical protein
MLIKYFTLNLNGMCEEYLEGVQKFILDPSLYCRKSNYSY